MTTMEALGARAKAAANLVVKLKDIINDSIEEAVHNSTGDDFAPEDSYSVEAE